MIARSSKKRDYRKGLPAKRQPDLELMLELFMLVRDPDRRYTLREIAIFCGCTWQYIWHIENQAICKLRRQFGRPVLLGGREA